MSNTDLKSFLSELSEINEANIVDILIPSTGKKVKFRLFNVNQQKDLIRTAFEGIEGAVKSGIIFNNIINDNSLKAESFSLIDRGHILLNLRKASIGESVSIKDKTYKLDDLPKLMVSDIKQQDSITYSDITVSVSIPSLERDTKVSEKIIGELSKLSDDNKQKESVNVLLVYEIIKYINSVSIKEAELDFSSLSIYECKKIVEALPLKLNNLIIDFIAQYKQIEENSLTFEDGAKVEIDASFLSSE